MALLPMSGFCAAEEESSDDEVTQDTTPPKAAGRQLDIGVMSSVTCSRLESDDDPFAVRLPEKTSSNNKCLVEEVS